VLTNTYLLPTGSGVDNAGRHGFNDHVMQIGPFRNDTLIKVDATRAGSSESTLWVYTACPSFAGDDRAFRRVAIEGPNQDSPDLVRNCDFLGCGDPDHLYRHCKP